MLSFLAAVSARGLIPALWELAIIVLIFAILYAVATRAPLEEPFKKIVVWIVILFGALMLINWLLGFGGNSFIQFH